MWFSKAKQPTEEPFFPWSKEQYAIGVSLFDLEHERLAAIINEVHAVLTVDRDRPAAHLLMEKLIQQTREHFVHEERIMKETQFPDLEAHAAEHDALLNQAKELLRQFHEGRISALAFPAFLKSWLISHIQASDRKYAPAMKRGGIR